MKLRTLTVYQFGRFKEKKIKLPQAPIIMIYGENESGKSTIMAFILSQLFGFPSKKQLGKWNGTSRTDSLGGSLAFTADNGRSYRIERMLGDKETLNFSTETGEPADLNKYMRGINQFLYENVFCFDLDGLRNIDKMNPADMNDLLLGAGMIGSGMLSKLEQTLEKQCADLFKKSGKKPQINRLFAELNNCSAQLREWEKKLDSYQQLQNSVLAGRERLKHLELKKKQAQHEYQLWTSFSAALPLINTYRGLSHELQSMMQDRPFPQNGKECYDDSRKLLLSIKNEISDLDEQIGQLEETRQMVHIDKRWQEQDTALHRLFGGAADDRQNEKERRRIEDEIGREQAVCRRICDLLGREWTPAAIRKASSEITLGDQLKEKIDIWKKLLDDRRDLARDLNAALERQERLEKQLKIINVKHEFTERTVRSNRAVSHPPKSRLLIIGLMILSAVLAVFSSLVIAPIAGLPVLLLGTAAIVCIFFFSFFRFDGQTNSIRAEDDRIFAERTLLEQQFNLAKAEAGRLAEKQKACSQSCEEQEEGIKSWLKEHGYFIDDLTGAMEKVRLVNDAQEHCQNLDVLHAKLQRLNDLHEYFVQETGVLAEKLGIAGADAAYLERCYQKQMEQGQRRDDLEKQIQIYRKQRERYMRRIAALENDQKAWFAKAHAENEQQFYEAAEREEHRHFINKQLETTRMQLLELTGTEKQIKVYMSYLEERKWDGLSEQDFKDRIATCETEIKNVRDRLANDQAQCSVLEKNDSYRDTLDRYHELLAEAGIRAKEWSAYQTALWAIHAAKEQYRKERLPRVLREAADYFCLVTAGRYKKIILRDDGFIVEDSNGFTLAASQLSRGTAEQLYLSLRLALMQVFDGYETLPMIIDDGFVNFDRKRSEMVYTLLKKVSEERQVIVLTCHDNEYLHTHPKAVLRLSNRHEQVSASQN
ncbi:AAA family ATPase [Sporolactobacillus shoreicorticis]|uniref:AAA family ATPase n=1 Tax=Sporolactobacillus shoreicorticis TaxID=1923877 RepID=A0ABW5RX33_9BACL|nr:AAA family ATPase [Sporolactobacillus shoreicorticis]MCO7124949.1 AAA family ATPase [Sporolactobacillus shoreicorticis]